MLVFQNLPDKLVEVLQNLIKDVGSTPTGSTIFLLSFAI